MFCLYCNNLLEKSKRFCNNSCYKKHYNMLHATQIKEQKQKYHKANKAKIVKRVGEWRQQNPDKANSYNRAYKKRNKNKPLSALDRLKHNIRTRIHDALNGRTKPASVSKSMGCSWKELKQHVEDQFHEHPVSKLPMTWGNLGKATTDNDQVWNLDHIKALFKFGDSLFTEEGFKEACSYKNIQPLWHCEHVQKTKEDISGLVSKKLVYLVTGAPGAGKSWVLSYLPEEFQAIDSDNIPKAKLVDEIQKSDKTPVVALTIGISTFINRNPQFDIKLLVIEEDESIIEERLLRRNGKITPTLAKRVKRMKSLAREAFVVGTSDQILDFFLKE